MPQAHSAKGYDFGSLSHRVIGACIDVQAQLGVHCMEVDYQRAPQLALQKKRGLWYRREVEIPIAYDGVVVTQRRVDLLIGDDHDDELIIAPWATSWRRCATPRIPTASRTSPSTPTFCPGTPVATWSRSWRR